MTTFLAVARRAAISSSVGPASGRTSARSKSNRKSEPTRRRSSHLDTMTSKLRCGAGAATTGAGITTGAATTTGAGRLTGGATGAGAAAAVAGQLAAVAFGIAGPPNSTQ